MLQDLLKKLEAEHGIDPAQGQNILNTIAMHVKEHFPMVGGMLDSVLGSTGNVASSAGVPNNENESTLQHLEDLAKSKLGGLFGGNKG